MDWWSLGILGKVNQTVIACLPDPDIGIVSKLEVVKLPDMFHRLQNSAVSDLLDENLRFSEL